MTSHNSVKSFQKYFLIISKLLKSLQEIDKLVHIQRFK